MNTPSRTAHRQYRGEGLGEKLIRTALIAAKERGLSRVELTVREHNETAIKLYEKFGFVREGLHINAVKINGRYENHISMALHLNESHLPEPTKQ